MLAGLALTRTHRPDPASRLRGHGLDDLEIEVLFLIAAPYLDASFATLFAFLKDSFVATAPGRTARGSSRRDAPSTRTSRPSRHAAVRRAP